MHKNLLTLFTLLFICITQHFQIIAQDLPRWEDYQPALVSNRINDAVLNSQGTTFLLSGDNFYMLKEGKQFFSIEATDAIQPDHIEINNSDQIWLVSENNFQFEGNHLAYGIYENGVLTTFLRENITGFPNDNSSNDDNITAFLIDAAGNSWFGFDNGDAGKIENQNQQYTHFPNTLVSDEEVRDMAIDPSNGDLYVTIQYHVYMLSNGIWSHTTENWTNNSFLEAVAVSTDGDILFAGYNGMHVLSNDIITTYDMSNSSSPINIIDDIKIIGSVLLYSGNDLDGVDYLVNGSFETIYTGVAESTNIYGFQSAIVVKNTNPLNIWLCTDEDGLVNVTPGDNYYYNNQTISLPVTNDFVYKSSIVGDKAYVVGPSGLTVKTDSLFEGFNPLYSVPPVALPGNGGAYHMTYDSSKFIYLATLEGLAKLRVIDNTVVDIYDASHPQVNTDRFYKVFNLKKGQVLAVTADQYFIINESGIASSKLLATAGLPTGSGWNAVVPEYAGGNVVGFWLASQTGFFYYDFSTVSNIDNSEVISLTQGIGGMLWLGYGDVIYSFDKVDQWEGFDLPEIHSSTPDEQDIIDLEFDFNNTLWVLAQFKTSGGSKVTKLLEYKNDVFTIIERQYQISDYSNDLAISPSGEKLIASRKGLFAYIDDSYSSVDPCLPVNCPEGTECVDGTCLSIADGCENVVCPEGQACYGGVCYDVCADDGECDPESVCINNLCIPVEEACTGVVCPEGQECFGGSCFDVCADDGECDPESVCINNLCIPIEEACTGIVCPEGQECFGGGCFDVCADDGECDPESVCINNLCIPIEEACTGIVCPEGQECFGGGCFDVCADDGECDPESVCYNDLCIPADEVCDLVTCPIGQICKNGECFDGCAFDTDCPEGFVCAGDICVPPEDACDYTSCPEGNICVYGACYPFNPFNDNVLNLSGNLFGELFSGGRIAENEPINGATIYLFNEGQTEINQFTTTDAEGKFNFEKLRPGTYKVFVDYPTYKVRGDGLITLKPSVKNTNLDIVLVSEEYELRLAYVTGLAEDFANRGVFTLYPNPSHGKIMLSSKEDIGRVDIRISDVTGKLLQIVKMNLPRSKSILVANLEGESGGLKIIEVYHKGQLILERAIIYSPE